MTTTVTDPYAAARAAWAAEMDRRWASRPDYDVLDIPGTDMAVRMPHRYAVVWATECDGGLQLASLTAYWDDHYDAPAYEQADAAARRCGGLVVEYGPLTEADARAAAKKAIAAVYAR